MIIKLFNFKKWKNKEFNIIDDKLTLLYGNSGCGKSSILNGIYFCLYGKGTKLVTYNEKKCKVELYIKDFEIIRTKNPNSLILKKDNNIYEDETAQSIINNEFGNFNVFLLTSYITQKSLNNFLNLSPTDKLIFLESLILKDDNVNTLKIKTKNFIKKFKEDYNKKLGELNIIKDEFKSIIKPDKVKFPLKGNDKKEEKINFYNELENIEKYILNLKEELNNLEYKFKINENNKLLKKEQENYINNITDKLNDLKNKKNNNTFNKNLLESLEESLKYILKKKELDILQNDFNNEKSKFEEIKQIELNNLNFNLDSKKKELEKEKENLVEYKNDENLNNLKNNLNLYLEYKKIKILKDQYKDEKETYEKIFNKEKEEITKKIKYIQKIDDNRDILKQRIEKITEYIKNKKILEEYNINLDKINDELSIYNINIKDQINFKENYLKELYLKLQIKSCPNCKCSLIIDKDNIILSNLNIEDKKDLEKNIKNIISEIKKLKENELNFNKLIKEKEILESNKSLLKFENDEEYKEEYLTFLKKEYIINEKEINQYNFQLSENEKFTKMLNDKYLCSSSIKTLYNNLLKKEKEVNKNFSDDIKNIDEEELRQTIIKEEQDKKEYYNKKIKIENLEKDIENLENKKNNLENNKDKYINFKNLKNIYIELLKINNKIKKYKEDIEENNNQNNIKEIKYTEFELRDLINIQKNMEKEILNINIEINNLENILKNINIIFVEDIDYKCLIKNKKEELENNNNKLENYVLLKNNLIKYENYIKEYKNYKKWEDKINKINNDEQDLRYKISIHELFYKKILEAENRAILDNINDINYYMNSYIDKFFPDMSLIVEINLYKESKTDIKPSINIKVYYNEIETDINSLSGGEFDRVNLSLVLALNTIYGNDLLILDESISSLHESLTSEILEILQSYNKTVIVVAHQIATGIFDNLIEIKD